MKQPSPLKILYVCRLYSGFEESVRTGYWAPTGAPTIAKMIEHLNTDDQYDLTLVLTCKDYNSNWVETEDQATSIQGFKFPIFVLAGQNALPTWLGKLRAKLNALRQLYKIYKIHKSYEPDLVYCDRINVLPAACFARFTQTPVIWRVMGVLEMMHNVYKKNTLRNRFTHLLNKSPFSAVICTLDGSGGGPWMNKALCEQTKQYLLINGFDKNNTKRTKVDLPENIKTRILFAGRIEMLKGPDILIEAVRKLVSENNTLNFQIIVAGYGSAENWMKDLVAREKLGNYFHFTGALTSEEMAYVRTQSNIYVSCGTHGNLTNTTLEALSDGLTVIMPEPDPITGIDIDTETFIPEDIAIRYGSQQNSSGLAKALQQVLCNKNMCETYATKAKDFAQYHIASWDERVKTELDIYQSIINEFKS